MDRLSFCLLQGSHVEHNDEFEDGKMLELEDTEVQPGVHAVSHKDVPKLS